MKRYSAPTEASESKNATPQIEEAEEQPDEDAPEQDENEQSTPHESALSAGFSLDGFLAEAAASASLLVTEAASFDKIGFAQAGEEEGGTSLTTLLVSGAVALAGFSLWLNSGSGNKPPSVDSAKRSVATNEDTALPITINASDPNGDNLTYSVTTAPGHGTATVTGNTISYVPAQDYNGSDSLVVTVTDPKGLSTTQAVNITVNPVNDAPTFKYESELKVLKQGQVLSESLAQLASDVDGDALTFFKTSNPGHGMLAVNPDGTLVYTPDLDFIGTDTFQVKVSDNQGGSDTLSYTVDIEPIPGPPIGSPLSEIEVDEDSSINYDTTIVNPNGPALLDYAIAKQPEHGRLVALSFDEDRGTPLGYFRYIPDPDYNGPDSFSISGFSGDGSFTEVVVVTVRPVNDDPTAPATQAAQTAAETPVNISLNATDKDGDHVTASVPVADRPSNGELSADPNDPDKLIYTPKTGFTGTDTFKITYSDGNGGTAKTTVTVTVTPDPNEPTENPPAGTALVEEVTNEDTPLQSASDISDPDGDSVTFEVTSGPTNGTVTINQDTGSYTYTPADDYNGTDSFFITGRNADGMFSQQVNVVIAPVNDDPVQEPGTTTEITVNNKDTAIFAIDFSDIDGDSLSAFQGNGPNHGVIILNADGTSTYDPEDNYVGTDFIDIKVVDGNGGVVDYTISITVTGAEEISIDGIDPSEPNGNFNAGTGDFIFASDATVPTHIIITNLETGDVIRIDGAKMDEYELVPGGNPADVFLESVGEPLVDKIFLPDIFPNGPPESYTFPDAFQAAGFNFVEFVP